MTVLSSENLVTADPHEHRSRTRTAAPSSRHTQLSTTTDPGSQNGGVNGQTLLNLRNLGTNRNLILLDGRRLVATNAANSVDIGTLPQNLVKRVDIVTGGASAAYGSDAVAGVVNFILDTHFTGFKGDFGGGISTYNNMGNFKGSLAWGHSFLDDRLHVIASASYVREYGIAVNESSGRKWFDDPVGLIPNTFASKPANLIVPDIRSSVGSDGGLITNTLLRGHAVSWPEEPRQRSTTVTIPAPASRAAATVPMFTTTLHRTNIAPLNFCTPNMRCPTT